MNAGLLWGVNAVNGQSLKEQRGSSGVGVCAAEGDESQCSEEYRKTDRYLTLVRGIVMLFYHGLLYVLRTHMATWLCWLVELLHILFLG